MATGLPPSENLQFSHPEFSQVEQHSTNLQLLQLPKFSVNFDPNNRLISKPECYSGKDG